MKLTADVFIVKSGSILLLERKGSSAGFWYIPGGFVEPGEDPAAAVVREAYEETALEIEDPQILRVWSYQMKDGRHAYHATYVAFAPEGEVVISSEHSNFKWMDPSVWRSEYLPSAIDQNDPVQTSFYPQLQKNVDLLLQKLD